MAEFPVSLDAQDTAVPAPERGNYTRPLSVVILGCCEQHQSALASNNNPAASFRIPTGTYSNMLKSNRLKQVFAEARRPAMGFWQMLPGANVSRVLARSGADWVMVDCEHGNIDGRESACIRPSSGVLHPTLGQRTLLMMASQMLPCTRQFPLLPLWVFPQLFEYQTSSHGW